MRRALTRSAAAALALALSLPLGATLASAVGAPGTPQASPVVSRAGWGAGVGGGSEPCDGPAVVCPDRVLFGLATPQVLALDARLTGVEAALGRRADLVESYQDFTEPIYTTRLRAAVRSGRTPVVTWEPFYAKRPKAATYPLARIAAGRYDAYLRRAAQQAAAVGAPFVIRFGHEMNGFWYPWGQRRPLHPQSVADTRNTPAAYVAAYRHVVDVFRAAGATNVAWMWSPNVTDANPAVTLASLYPGNRYVDVLGLSGYLEKPSDTFETRLRRTLEELSALGPGKPLVLAETGVVKAPGRAAVLGRFLAAVAAERRVLGVIYFSQPDKAVDYRIDADPEALGALRTALASAPFSRGGLVARTPVVRGIPRVGGDLEVDWAWRGTAERAVGTWFSCPDEDTPPAGCTRIGWGSRLPLTTAVRGRYVRATLGVLNASASDAAVSTAVGPVLTTPPLVAPAGIDLLAEAVRVSFPTGPEWATRWVVRLDDGPAVYLPVTTPDYYLKGLAAGSRHTVTLAATDGDSVGPSTTRSFVVLAKPSVPTIAATPGGFTATLPPPVPGQTGWVAVTDSVEEELPLSTTTVVRTGLTTGQHSFGLRAVAGDGRTSATVVFPMVR